MGTFSRTSRNYVYVLKAQLQIIIREVPFVRECLFRISALVRPFTHDSPHVMDLVVGIKVIKLNLRASCTNFMATLMDNNIFSRRPRQSRYPEKGKTTRKTHMYEVYPD